MNEKPENPAAFPMPAHECELRGPMTGQGGMTLRDYFAAKVMQSSLTHVQNQCCLGSHNEKDIAGLATDSYLMADAMLKARTNAYKGNVTKLKKRASAGLCPCCNRHFTNLQRHIASKHPDINKEEKHD